MARSVVPEFPPRFCLLANNNKYVSRALEPNLATVHCIGEIRDAPQVVFEVGSPHPDAINNPSTVMLWHVETGKVAALWAGGAMAIYNDEELSYESYFRLEAADVSSNRATLFVTSRLKPGHLPSHLIPPPEAHFIRFSRTDTNAAWSQNMLVPDWGLPNNIPPGQSTIPTIFTVYDSALSKVWREVQFFNDRATIENIQPFSSSVYRFDNSDFDQTVIMRPSLRLTETMHSTWNRTNAFGFSQSISITARIPFAMELEVGFTAEQSFGIEQGGGHQLSVENAVEVEVPVPPFRRVEIIVNGVSGRVTIPFRFVEIATYTGGIVRERVLEDGVCSNISSVTTEWRARYTDTDDQEIGQRDVGFDIPSGKFTLI